VPVPPPNSGGQLAGRGKGTVQNALCRSQGQDVTAPDLKAQIAGEIYVALERPGAEPELLAIVGSWLDTLPDVEVLAMLRDYNATGGALHWPR
jgi:hypothetical protein